MGFLSGSREQVVPRTLLVLLRLYLGFAFLLAGLPKLRGAEDWPARMAGAIEGALPRSYDFYRSFLEGTVLPHKEVFAALVAWGEVLVGAALLLGLCTRGAALAGLVMNVNYLLMSGQHPLGPMNNAAFIFLELVVLLGAAGRALGVDYFLAKKWPRLPLW
ncbi:MAG: DoxX family membrane protein [Terriglobia bacterium]